MVRRRGTYQITICDKQLICLFCQHNEFQHREIYMERISLNEDEKEQLHHVVMFEYFKKKYDLTIRYKNMYRFLNTWK